MFHSAPLVVCVSTHHENTRKVAEVIAQTIGATIVSPEQVDMDSIEQHSVIGFGSGIYFGRHASTLINLTKRLPRKHLKVFVFSTAGTPILWKIFHARLRGLLRSRTCEILGEFNCRGWDTIGPLAWLGGLNRGHPDQYDLERAREFARSLPIPNDRV